MCGEQDSSKKWLNRVWKAEVSGKLIAENVRTIKLMPNDNGTPLAVHVELLCFFCTYYSAALKRQFNEAKKDALPIELSGEELQVFVTWIVLYNQGRTYIRV